MLTVLVVAALVLGLLGLVTGALALRTLGRLRRSVSLLSRGSDGRGESFVEVSGRLIQMTEQAQRGVELLRGDLARTVQRVALVRFDGFDDQSGRLSFSLALLDGRGDGVTLTALTGRSDTRLYAKPITAGTGVVDLSPEERQAVSAALAS